MLVDGQLVDEGEDCWDVCGESVGSDGLTFFRCETDSSFAGSGGGCHSELGLGLSCTSSTHSRQ